MSVHHTEAEIKGLTNEPDRANRALYFRNSTVRLEPGPAGTVARIDHYRREEPDYAGPLPESTIDALERVASRGDAR